MMAELKIVLLIGLGAATITALALLLYIDLRIHALVQSKDLTEPQPRLFQVGVLSIGPDLRTLFSRALRETDSHTRVLVPIARIAILAAPACGLAFWLI